MAADLQAVFTTEAADAAEASGFVRRGKGRRLPLADFLALARLGRAGPSGTHATWDRPTA